jgi:hypothetical protein
MMTMPVRRSHSAASMVKTCPASYVVNNCQMQNTMTATSAISTTTMPQASAVLNRLRALVELAGEEGDARPF